MRRLLLAAVTLLPAAANAQSSQFGVNGLGLPGRHTSARAAGSGGAFAFFDGNSSISPASMLEQGTLTASFTTLQNYRSSANAAGSLSGRDTRFPQVAIAGPLRRIPLALGVSFSTYTDRDFSVASSDIVNLRGVPVPVADTLTSEGGLSDLRLAAAYRVSGWTVGAGLHLITGSNRTQVRRTFEDSAYAPIRERAEIAYSGLGASLGISRPLTPELTIAAGLRVNGDARIDRDSTEVADVDIPLTFGGALRWRPSPRLDLAASATARRWSAADDDLRTLGGTGARSTIELSAGAEFARNVRRAQQRPVRLGVRYATLPFPVESGAQPREIGLAVGSGFRFAQDRLGLDHAGLDVALERVWRRASGGYSEGAWLISFGVLVRP